MLNADIVIIDSGVNLKRLSFKDDKIQGINIYKEDDLFKINDDINDLYGHGTAIYKIIKKHSNSKNIINLKIFSSDASVDEEILIFALKYIRNNISCKIVNLSMGLKICNSMNSLKEICNELTSLGVIIISAFDNDGCYSYPAVFDNIIGVDSSYKCVNAFQFEYVEESPINIRGKGGLQRIAWSDNKNIVLGGSSFACAYVSAYVSNLMLKKTLKFNDVLTELKKVSIKIHKKINYRNKSDKYFKIKNAAVFPFNKEMHSIVRFSNDLNFKVSDVYDIKYSARVGANVNNLLNNSNNEIQNHIIKDINLIDFKSIDTIIIGHLDEINRIMKKDIRKDIVIRAINNNVNVFSYDNLEYCSKEIENRISKVYYPYINMTVVPQNTFGKLFIISKPVLAVFGTSSKQGKFTLQNILKKLLSEAGYKVGLIGTEPHSLLFNMDYVYPMGYNSAIYIDGHSSIILLNKMLNDLCCKGNEIIITGSQSNSIPTNFMNVSAFPVKQHNFLLGVQPDAVVLCINPQDDINYIRNTVKYLEGIASSNVICLVMFPMILKDDWRAIFDVKEKANKTYLIKIAHEIENELSLPVLLLGDDVDMKKMLNLVIEFF